jgi:hypothetical protein
MYIGASCTDTLFFKHFVKIGVGTKVFFTIALNLETQAYKLSTIALFFYDNLKNGLILMPNRAEI